MTKTDRTLREIARRVLSAHAASRGRTAAASPEAMEQACGALYRILETAMGPAGLDALVGRAIQLASREYPWLATVKPGPAAECPLSGLAEAVDGIGTEEAAEAYAALLANIVTLLVTFIGEDLTLRFERHAWPNVSFSRLSEGSTK